MKGQDVEIIFTNQGDFPGQCSEVLPRTGGTGGAGLGLAIAKQIVELHGGLIRAKSDDSKTQFIVTLPTRIEKEEGTAEDEVHTHRRRTFRSKPGRRKHVQREEGEGDLE